MVLPNSDRVSRVRPYLGNRREKIEDGTNRPDRFRLRDRHPLRSTFPDRSASGSFCNSLEAPQRLLADPTTPHAQRLRAITCVRFGLLPFRSPLLGESLLLSFPGVTEMCHFTPLTSTALCIQAVMTPVTGRRVAPFGNPRI